MAKFDFSLPTLQGAHPLVAEAIVVVIVLLGILIALKRRRR